MDLVQLMGGRVYRDLNVSVTHLVAGEVGSKKYFVAASLGKPILLPSWVKACWEKSQDRQVLIIQMVKLNISVLSVNDPSNSLSVPLSVCSITLS